MCPALSQNPTLGHATTTRLAPVQQMTQVDQASPIKVTPSQPREHHFFFACGTSYTVGVVGHVRFTSVA